MYTKPIVVTASLVLATVALGFFTQQTDGVLIWWWYALAFAAYGWLLMHPIHRLAYWLGVAFFARPSFSRLPYPIR
ncbi:MAG: hypothetical protein R2795_14430 [Saprospiraceae bacterium]